MATSNYTRGARSEREAIKIYEEKGYLCIRAAGSHGLFDFVALPTEEDMPEVVAVQVRSARDASRLRSLMIAARDEIDEAVPNIACQVQIMGKLSRRGWITWTRVGKGWRCKKI